MESQDQKAGLLISSKRKMLLTEQIQILYSKELSELCHLAKNLYNVANWYIRQDYFHLNNVLSYYDLDFILKHKKAYRKLPSQTSQQILKLVCRDWNSYFKGLKKYKEDYKKFKKKPRIQGYKKKNGESIVIFTNQQCRIKEGYLHFPRRVNLKPIKTRIKNKLKEVRIIPLGYCYKVEIIYNKEAHNLGLNQENILAIDLGLILYNLKMMQKWILRKSKKLKTPMIFSLKQQGFVLQNKPLNIYQV